MSSGRRGRGAFERGARGGSGITRGSAPRGGRGRGNDGTTPTTPYRGSSDRGNRGQCGDRGARGGTPRGGAFTRGNQNGASGGFSADGASMTPAYVRTTLGNPTANGMSNTTPFAQDDYKNRYQFLEEYNKRLKHQLIADKKMNPEGQLDLKLAVKKFGTCMEMCSEFERVRRIEQNDLMSPEYTAASLKLNDRAARTPDESRMVKAYRRSDAGADEEYPTEIRPPTICLKTMHWMMERLDNEPVDFLQSWLWDRTRALRKDLRAQAIESQEGQAIYMEIFEECARFHLISMHHMSLSPSEDYSHQQDLEQLNQTCISLKEKYADNRQAQILSPNEPELQAYRLILALYTGDPKVENEIGSLPQSLRQNRRMQVAIEIHRLGKLITNRSRRLSEAQQNWAAFWKLIGSSAVSYLMACAAEIAFNKIRHIVLDTIFRAYKSGAARQSTPADHWTTTVLIEMLGFDTEDQVRDFCGLYDFSFLTNPQGETFLDISSVPYAGRALQEPYGLKPQTFSRRLVESKRYNRLLSAVIKEPDFAMEDEGSLFIPDHSTTNAAMTDSTPKVDPFQQSAPTAQPNVFSAQPSNGFPSLQQSENPFGPKTGATATPAPFGTSTTTTSFPSTGTFGNPSPVPSSTTGSAPTTFTGSFGKPSPFPGSSSTATPTISTGTFGQPSPFPSSSSATTPAASTATFGQPSSFAPSSSTATPAAPTGTFGQPSSFPPTSSAATPVTSFTSATGQTIQPGLFDASKNSVKFSSSTDSAGLSVPPNASGSSTGFNFAAPSKAPEQTPSQPSAPWSLGGAIAAAKQGDAGTPATASAPFSFSTQRPETPATAPPGILKQPPQTAATGPNSFSFSTGSSGPAPSPGTNSPPKKVSFEDDEQRQAREEQERREREEKERREREESERRAREEQERLRRARESMARQEQERRVREEQQRAAELQRQQEEARNRKESAYDALTKSVFLDHDQGLLGQFIEQQVRLMLPQVKEELEDEKAEKLANDRYQQRKERLLRVYAARWFDKIARRKRAEQARASRRRRRENAARLLAASVDETPTPSVEEHRPTKPTEFKKPMAPASASRVERPAKTAPRTTNGVDRKGKSVLRPSNGNSIPNSVASTSSNGSVTSEVLLPYKSRTMPIDRTQTSWFKLRAQGLDPSKILKRSHDDSDPEEAEQETDHRKRVRTSTDPGIRPSPPISVQPHGAPSVMDRWTSFKQSFNMSRSGSTPQHRPRSNSIQGSTPNRNNELLAKGRAVLSRSGTPQGSPPPTHVGRLVHDFSRSVPNLGLSQYGRSSFGQSSGSLATADKPAYWARKSRFVPQHLYGKGPDAVSDYFRQSRGESVASSQDVSQTPVQNLGPMDFSSPVQGFSQQPGVLSSPLETQQSYIPTQQPQPNNNWGSQAQAQYSTEEDSEMSDHGGQGDEDDEEMSELEENEEGGYGYGNGAGDYDGDGMDYESGSGSRGYSESGLEEGSYDEDEEDGYGQPYHAPQQHAQIPAGPGATRDDPVELGSDSD